MRIEFESERFTKNAVKFTEVVMDDQSAPKIGTLYVKKDTLRELGWEKGVRLSVTLEISK